MNKTSFSCVVPVKGERPFFAAAVKSLAGEKARLEASGAGTLEIIVQDADVEPDRGQSDALNRGFARATGEWLFWLNADDVLLKGALGKVAAAAAGGCEWIAGNTVVIDERGAAVKCVRGCGWHDWLFRRAVPHVGGPSAFFRRGLFSRAGGFDVSLDVCMDWDLWIKFMRAGAGYRRLGEYLWGFRRWRGSKTQRETGAEEARRHREEVERMLAANGFRPTRAGKAALRLWKLISGVYAAAALDTLKMRGRAV
ncbi:MAG: glycosyltransferase [Kiritimatiellae bacterium]|nr:glycosyltransferase [Kiritimatiellia bacterium]